MANPQLVYRNLEASSARDSGFNSSSDTIVMEHRDTPLEELEDVAELRRRVSQAQQRENENRGGSRSILLKIEPPSLDDYESYSVWRKKLKMWCSAVSLSDRQQALSVASTIHDKHSKHKIGLASLMVNTMSTQDLENPSMEKILSFLDEQLLVDTHQETYDRYLDFEECQIKYEEKFTDFTARFDATYKTLLQTDADVTIPDKLLSLKLMRSARLPSSTLMNVRANVKFSGTGVYKETIKAINNICAGEKSKGESTWIFRLQS